MFDLWLRAYFLANVWLLFDRWIDSVFPRTFISQSSRLLFAFRAVNQPFSIRFLTCPFSSEMPFLHNFVWFMFDLWMWTYFLANFVRSMHCIIAPVVWISSGEPNIKLSCYFQYIIALLSLSVRLNDDLNQYSCDIDAIFPCNCWLEPLFLSKQMNCLIDRCINLVFPAAILVRFDCWLEQLITSD